MPKKPNPPTVPNMQSLPSRRLRRLVLFLALWLLGTLVGRGTRAIAGGEIRYAGSSTIGEHILPQAIKVFTAKTGIHFGPVGMQGSGKGLEMVLHGEVSLGGMSRSLTDAEKRERIRYRIIGYDAVAVVVHASNPVKSLTKDQIKSVFAGRVTNWKDVGGTSAPITCITQIWGNKRSEMIELNERLMDAVPYRADRKEVDTQPEQVAALVAQPYGITFVSLAFIGSGIRPITIDGVDPNANNIRSGAYILSRPLLLVTPPRPTPEVDQFLAFILSTEGQRIVGQKFVPVL
jgi:phosphate transport system substrate-binding protein